MAEAGPSNAVVPAQEPEVDLTIHASGIVPQLQVRRRLACLRTSYLLLLGMGCLLGVSLVQEAALESS